MYVRLAFSVAAHLDPDILLLDEVLAVGDLAFQRKCMEFAKELQKRDATILFVSHNMFSIKTMCERVIYLKKGTDRVRRPDRRGHRALRARLPALDSAVGQEEQEEMPVNVTECVLSDEAGEPRELFDFGERMRLRITLQAHRRLKNPNIIVAFMRSDGVVSCNYSERPR